MLALAGGWSDRLTFLMFPLELLQRYATELCCSAMLQRYATELC